LISIRAEAVREEEGRGGGKQTERKRKQNGKKSNSKVRENKIQQQLIHPQKPRNPLQSRTSFLPLFPFILFLSSSSTFSVFLF
jgi:hypothetical protein